MAAWRHPAVETSWAACDAGLRDALDRARRVAAAAPEVEGFGGLLGLVTSLLDPLEPFGEAEAVFRDLHRRGSVRTSAYGGSGPSTP